MIYITKNLAEVNEGIVAHGVNCRGVMGSGVAKALRAAHPSIYPPYKRLCDASEATGDLEALLGKAQLITLHNIWTRARQEYLSVANCFTQLNYGNDGRVYADADAIFRSLDHVFFISSLYQVDVYMPRIGCGLGGLNWKDLEPEIQKIYDKYSSTSSKNLYVCDL